MARGAGRQYQGRESHQRAEGIRVASSIGGRLEGMREGRCPQKDKRPSGRSLRKGRETDQREDLPFPPNNQEPKAHMSLALQDEWRKD